MFLSAHASRFVILFIYFILQEDAWVHKKTIFLLLSYKLNVMF